MQLISMKFFAPLLCSLIICGFTRHVEAGVRFVGEKKLNGIVSELLEVTSISRSSNPFLFNRPNDGWIFITVSCRGEGTVSVLLDKGVQGGPIILGDKDDQNSREAMRYVSKGKHRIQVQCVGKV